MTILQQFRLWARRSSVVERVSALVGAVLVVAVISWLLVPASQRANSKNVAVTSGNNGFSAGGSSDQAAGAQAAGTAVPGGGGAGGAGGAGAAGSAAGSTAAGAPGSRAAGATGSSAACRPSADQGVTSSQINIAVILIQLVGPSSNQVVGVPSPQEQQKDFQAVIDNVNSSGGVACRKLVATYYTPNIADQSQLQQTCLQIVQSKPFAAIDLGAFSFFPAVAACIPQNQVPQFSGLPLPQKSRDQFYPYWFSITGIADPYHRNAIFALAQRGFFSAANGFTKLGVDYRDCDPEYYPEVKDALHQVGVSDSQIVPFDAGCPSTAVTPTNVVEQAVLTFQQNRVSHVTFIDDVASFEGGFTSIAQRQGFHPKYGFPDDGYVAVSNTGGPVDWQNLNGAISINENRYGEPTTPGLSPTPGTARCDAILTQHGLPSTYKSGAGIGGVACDDIWMIAASIDHAPALQRNALVAGLQASQSVDFSFPEAPNDFRGDHVTGGGQFWRPVQADAGCTCWRVIDPNFKLRFPQA
jgi:hypothetical protein